MTLQEEENQGEQEEEQEILLPNTTIVTHCILKNDISRLTQCFENDADPYKETVPELLNERDPDGKSPLDIAAALERADMMKELLQRGADVSSISDKGAVSCIVAIMLSEKGNLLVLFRKHCFFFSIHKILFFFLILFGYLL